jgi:hypothetical protein
MTANSGRSESRLTSTVLAVRPGQPLGQPVSHGLLDRVAVRGPDARVKLGVQLLELVLDLGPGRAADLLADPLPVRGETR